MKLGSIAIDLDDTLNILLNPWLEVYNAKYNDNLKPDDIKEWNVANFVKCSEKEMFDIIRSKGFFRTLKVKAFAKEVVEFLSKYFDLYVVTAYLSEAVIDKTEFIKEHFPQIPEKNIIFCNAKHLILTDFMIDDGVHNLVDFKGTPLLMDSPQNRKCDKYKRFYNWIEIYHYFLNIVLTNVDYADKIDINFTI